MRTLSMSLTGVVVKVSERVFHPLVVQTFLEVFSRMRAATLLKEKKTHTHDIHDSPGAKNRHATYMT